MIEAYPLSWPMGYPRTQFPDVNGRFEGSFAASRDEILHQLKKMGATDVIISSNVPLKKDGYPYASFGVKDFNDNGIAVYFKLDGNPSVLCCDKWQRIEWNMRAIAKTIDAMRGLDRWGVSDILKRVFTGFNALPSSVPLKKDWWEILGVDQNADKNIIAASYRLGAKFTHPDMPGGSEEKFRELQDAYEVAMKLFP